MVKKFLFATTTNLAQESISVFCTRLLKENQELAVMGPAGLKLPEGVKYFSRTTEALEFAPDVVVPMDEKSIIGVKGIFQDKKPKFLNKEPLAYQVASSRSFGLSLLAKVGMKVIPYFVVANEGDILRFQAKQNESSIPWELVRDHPDQAFAGTSDFGLGLQKIPGKIVRMAFLLSGRHLVKPSFAYTFLEGLLEKGGVRDYRGLLVVPTSSPETSRIGEYVRSAFSAIGANGFVFLDLLYPEDGSEVLVSRVSLTPPQGFLCALFLSELVTQPLALALYSTAKGIQFSWQIKWHTNAWAHLLCDSTYQEGEQLPLEPGFFEVPAGYVLGYYAGTHPEVPQSLWDMRPTAEVKLHSTGELDKLMSRLLEHRLYEDYSSRKQEQIVEEKELEEAISG